MMKSGIRIVGIFSILFLVGCNAHDEVNVPLESEVNEFVWQGMQTFYFWQDEIADLAVDRFQTFEDRNAYLNGFATPEQLFDNLLFSQDRFSWMVDDYLELENSFRGISKSFGYEFSLVQLNNLDVFGYIEYVLPGSPAEQAGLNRGDVFFEADGTTLNASNFSELLFDRETLILSLGTYIDRDTPIEDLGLSRQMTAVEISENPILRSEVLNVGGVKIGYMVYNQFVRTYHSELNQAFGELASEGITELVLDLRYNPGGSLTTSRVLASMIYGEATGSTLFGSIVYNQNLSEFGSEFTFLDEVPIFDEAGDEVISEEAMNELGISRVFILTTSGTASASELIIAGLEPFVDVIQIGGTTAGKNVGSITIYDSPEDGYLSRENVNPNHRYAMQPIVSQLANAVGFSDYTNGLAADIPMNELDFVAEGLKELGSLEEPFLAQAISIITGVGRFRRTDPSSHQPIFNSKDRNPQLSSTKVDLENIGLPSLP